jgi:hypothetical protein
MGAQNTNYFNLIIEAILRDMQRKSTNDKSFELVNIRGNIFFELCNN